MTDESPFRAHSRQGSSGREGRDDVWDMMRYAELASAHRSGRGTVLLLDHCARIGRLMGPRAESARSRLEATLGDELTRSLLGSLCGPGQARGRS